MNLLQSLPGNTLRGNATEIAETHTLDFLLRTFPIENYAMELVVPFVDRYAAYTANDRNTRLGILAAVWLGTIGVYFYGYNLGFQLMFLLSYLHVFLEFPLNHMSILGTVKELPAALGLGTPRPAR